MVEAESLTWEARLRRGPVTAAARIRGPHRSEPREEQPPAEPRFAGIAAVLDEGGIAAAFYDTAARRVAETRAVARLRAEDDDVGALVEMMDVLAGETLGGPPDRTTCHYVHTAHWAYRLVGGPAATSPGDVVAGAGNGDVAALVVVVRLGRETLSDATLRARYALSAREVEVARLVAEGMSTPQAARALGVSPHTARHHLERVFAKMRVTSRAALAAVVRGGA